MQLNVPRRNEAQIHACGLRIGQNERNRAKSRIAVCIVASKTGGIVWLTAARGVLVVAMLASGVVGHTRAARAACDIVLLEDLMRKRTY